MYALYTQGGIYLDSDVLLLKRFDGFLDNSFFSSMEYHPIQIEKCGTMRYIDDEGRRTADVFIEEGGFTERMSRARIEARDENARNAHGKMPKCPKCGRPLRKMVARKGRNAGNEFWGCSGYPDCDFTRNL